VGRFEIRAALPSDLPQLSELARFLDTVNLPDEPRALEALLELSEASFTGRIASPTRREYVFVLRDVEADRAVGTSMVIGQLGRRDAPYIFFDVQHEERYSRTLDRHFIHTVLVSRYVYSGPSEVGGLVMHPQYRKRTERLGTLISYVRFLFVAMHRASFRDQLLAELLPPLEADGTSHLWEAVGRHFTGLDYREADRLSKHNKEFIKELFPPTVYATVLSEAARAVIGQVGAQTRGVERMLKRIGFEYAGRVDPFDGGPHFTAPTDRVSLVQQSAERLVTVGEGPFPTAVLAARNCMAPPYFHACPISVFLLTDGRVCLSQVDAEALKVADGDQIWVLPLPTQDP
jgi:arginine N-succinyltransferase